MPPKRQGVDLDSLLQAITGSKRGSVSLVPVGDTTVQWGNTLVVAIVIIAVWLVLLKSRDIF
jgi:hypothetical protein